MSDRYEIEQSSWHASEKEAPSKALIAETNCGQRVAAAWLIALCKKYGADEAMKIRISALALSAWKRQHESLVPESDEASILRRLLSQAKAKCNATSAYRLSALMKTHAEDCSCPVFLFSLPSLF